jgi:uncharacterized coiled-coil DUF342 family protein
MENEIKTDVGRIWRKMSKFIEGIANLEKQLQIWRKMSEFREKIAILEKKLRIWRKNCEFGEI